MNSMNADVIRLFLVFFLIAIFLLAVSYLRRQQMSCWAYAFWETFALLLPAFSPFFVIAYRPGESVYRECGRLKPRSRRRSHIQR